MRPKRKELPILVFSILLPQVIGFIGAYFTFPSIASWYLYLDKPFINPPNWIFGPVWTLLYFLMGISFFLVLRSGIDKKTIKPIQIFLLQLFFNLLWSIVFFFFHSIFGGLVVIVILWVLILLTILKFSKISRLSSILLIPYLAWVTFATVLNVMLWMLNR